MSKSVGCFVSCVTLVLFMVGCGSGKHIQSVEMTPTSADLVGIGATQQFDVIAVYNDGTSIDVTSRATFSIAVPNPPAPATPPNVISVNGSGLAQGVLGACTWTTTTVGTAMTFATSPYVLTATFQNLSATSFVSVASLSGCLHP